MARKRHKPDEIVAKLRQVEVLTAQGRSIAEAANPTASASGGGYTGSEKGAYPPEPNPPPPR